MRLIHTSDWHLGRRLHGEDLLHAQAAYVDHLVEVVRAESVDAVLVSGDVYDRALPSVEAVSLCHDALARLAATGTRVVVTGGNHDSPTRLGFAADLIDAAGVHLRTDPAHVGRPVLLGDADLPVAVYPIPYLEPDAVAEPWALPRRTHACALTEASARIRADLAARPPGTRSVVMAHAFLVGGQPSDSERDISVGGVSAVPHTALGGFDYVALGHLHGRQDLGGGIRYSGSPLAYSFSEARQIKSSWLIDLGPDGVRSVEAVESPVPRRMAMVRGRLDDLVGSATHAGLERHWLQVTLTDPVRPRAAMERLRERFPHVLVLRFEPDRSAAGDADPEAGPSTWGRRLHGHSPDVAALDFVAEVRGQPADEAETALLYEAFTQCRHAEVSA